MNRNAQLGLNRAPPQRDPAQIGQQYQARLVRAAEAVISQPQQSPAFYALVIHTHPRIATVLMARDRL